MRSLTSLAPRRAWLAAAAALLAVTVGAATAAPAVASTTQAGSRSAAATTSGLAPAKVKLSWHALQLVNGWKSASTPGLLSGKPGWALHDGVIYLRGAVTQPVAGSDVITVLPKIARPEHDLYIEVYTSGEEAGVLYIGPGGYVQAYEGNSALNTSLGGVSYPLKTVVARKLALKNGWTSSESMYKTGNPSYSVSHGVVYLSGSLRGGAKTQAFVLPRAARPSHRMYITVYTLDGSTGWLTINAKGQVNVLGNDSTGYTSLANISFPVASTKWHLFPLTGGWTSDAHNAHTAAPSYAVVNGIVFLTGSMHQTSGSTGLWTRIPAAARPSDVVHIQVYTAGGTNGTLAMSTSLGLIGSNPFSQASDFSSLAGVAYPPSA